MIGQSKRKGENIHRLRRLEPEKQGSWQAQSLPMSSVALAWGPITIEGYVPKNSADFIMSNERFVSPGYFAAMGVPLVKGRLFDERDIKGAAFVVPPLVLGGVALLASYFPARRAARVDPTVALRIE